MERTVELLARAERPLLVGGDGVFWSARGCGTGRAGGIDGGTPVYSRRGTCALAEDQPLAVQGACKNRSPAGPTW